jgi:hypothetical protein
VIGRAAALAILCAVAVLAQASLAPPGTAGGVRVQFAPEQLPAGAGLRGMYPWAVRVCSTSAAERSIDPEAVYMASGAIPVKSPARVRLAFAAAPKRTKKAIAAEWATEAVAIASGLTGFGAVAASTKVVGSLAVGVYLGGRVSKRLSETEDLAPYLDGLLDSKITLAPGACATRTLFSGPMRPAELRKYDITIP